MNERVPTGIGSDAGSLCVTRTRCSVLRLLQSQQPPCLAQSHAQQIGSPFVLSIDSILLSKPDTPHAVPGTGLDDGGVASVEELLADIGVLAELEEVSLEDDAGAVFLPYGVVKVANLATELFDAEEGGFGGGSDGEDLACDGDVIEKDGFVEHHPVLGGGEGDELGVSRVDGDGGGEGGGVPLGSPTTGGYFDKEKLMETRRT